ncbi:conserved Plasmodium protein, unknown function [Plasmodium knowlesi strain H]|uniref:Uncharacterized protein n=1 Tax=Plasmodium knowlesi (strain H) TaxID=5851 RepID=A0A5K1VAA3_PLAKH|nr:conserved Plasmodium protein, unknown function [Plasmodium knowlesi strain H]SBO28186.1 conserved Plasmodium protein, unknown function [Plasmodium knowlesi strain H]|eukprot:XP_002258226.1 hypothetical protein, conserved in Plasmodium species [Plasmodium knowlesi strain H]
MVRYSCGFLLSLLGALTSLVRHDHEMFFPVVNCNTHVLNHGKGGKTSGQPIQPHLGVSNPTEIGKFSAVEKGDAQSGSNVENELEDKLKRRQEGEVSRSSSRGVGLLSDVSPHNAGKPFEDYMGEENNPDEPPSNNYIFFETTNDRAIKKVDSLSQPGKQELVRNIVCVHSMRLQYMFTVCVYRMRCLTLRPYTRVYLLHADQQKLLQNDSNWAQMPNIGISCREMGCPKTYQMCVPFFYDSANFEGKRLIEFITSTSTLKMNGLKFDNENIIEDKRKYILIYSCVCKKYTSNGSCDESVE